MTQTRFSTMIILILVVGLFVSGFGVFMTGLASNYAVDDSEYENISSVFISEQNRTLTRIDSTRSSITNVQEDEGLLDRLSSFFRAGYDTAIILMDSFDSFGRLINTGIRQVPFLGGFGTILATVLIGIVLIIVIVRIFLHFLIKSDRL